MRNIRLAFLFLLLILTGAWLLADTLSPTPFTYFSFRTVFVQLTGVLAIGMMSVAMVLALRLRWIERRLSGLDKMYRLHKWLGIGALPVAVLHWWWAQGTKWMVGWGWLERPVRGGRQAGQGLSELEQWWRGQRGLAEALGEWAFYALALLIVLALIKRFPYHLFRKTHTLLAPAYLLLAWHSLVLIKPEYWTQPIGWIMALLLLAGSLSALLVLAGRVGHGRKVPGVVASLDRYPGVRAMEGCIHLDQGWPGHLPGQFAFVTSKHSEGAHPYTIASAWDPQVRNLVFVVKALGDWTGQLPDYLKEGMSVTVEGPYGCFDFEDNQPRQIWIGAGVGITPFIAKMKHLAKHPTTQVIDLFHVTSEYDEVAMGKLAADAAAANVRLHLHMTPEQGLLTAGQIRALVPDWRDASIWFCGPAPFGDALRKDFRQNGMPATHFHQELFGMR
jgi:predicted ferric reductase